MITNMTWYRMPSTITFGPRSNVVSINPWAHGSIWWTADSISSTIRYYAAVLNAGTGIYKSIISAKLYPEIWAIDNDDNSIYAKLRPLGVYNGYLEWGSYQGASLLIYKAYTGAFVMLSSDIGFVGFVPHVQMPYWTVMQNYIAAANDSPFIDGTASPQGTATKTYTLMASWPRWELDGRGIGELYGVYPKPGAYSPVDGMVGSMTFGVYDEENAEYVMNAVSLQSHVEGSVVTWL